MVVRRLCSLVAALLLAPGLAWAAPEGKIIIAQGVDPTTLDMMNQSEQPAQFRPDQILPAIAPRQ